MRGAVGRAVNTFVAKFKNSAASKALDDIYIIYVTPVLMQVAGEH